jgi:hypothetical protein
MVTEQDYLDLPYELPEYPVMGCECMTKTPDPRHHERYCAVWDVLENPSAGKTITRD